MNQEPNYVEIREPGSEKLLCKYDPERQLLEFQRRGVRSLIDLKKITHRPRTPDTLPDRRRARRRPS